MSRPTRRCSGSATEATNDVRKWSLRLSPDVYDGRSISAIAVGAHEAGHAVQHAHAYAWLNFRSAMVPVAGIGSNLWIWIFFAGSVAVVAADESAYSV